MFQTLLFTLRALSPVFREAIYAVLFALGANQSGENGNWVPFGIFVVATIFQFRRLINTFPDFPSKR